VSSTEGEGRHSPAAIDGLFQEFAPELRAFLLGVLKDWHLAEEVLQATFARAVARGSEIHNETRRGWLFQVAYREAMLVRRKQGVEVRILRGLAWLKHDDRTHPADRLIGEEAADCIRNALRSLPEDQRQVVLRRIDGNQTFAEIAAELGVPLGTVLTRMRLALGKLQQQLNELR
jgi:RNA polymerase sigma-70 factor (ECF subfamily)